MPNPTACIAWPAQPPAGGGLDRRRTARASPAATAFLAVILAAAAAAAMFFLCLSNLSSAAGSYSLSSRLNIPDNLTRTALQQSAKERQEKIAEEEGKRKEKEDAAAVLEAPPPAHDGDRRRNLTTSPARKSGDNDNIMDRNLSRIESMLARSRFSIKKQVSSQGNSTRPPQDHYIPNGPIYKNARAFHWSYLEMEKLFRVYVYGEGEPPLFHDGPCKSIYSMEGLFISAIESETTFKTRDPEKAHVFFLPFSVTKMVKFLYRPKSFDISPIKLTIEDYVDVISQKYRFWNRSLGADHFILSCHDWAPEASSAKTHLYHNSIRVLCNANISEGFNPVKDVSLPEINLKTGDTAGIIGGPSPSHRPLLAFFAGGLHGPIRPLLLEHWKDKDMDVKVYEYLPPGISYYGMMRKAKFCICPSGYEVASPRIVEAIYLECVPVVISDGYVLPFSDVLNWKAFSIQIETKDIPRLKEILLAVSPRQYIRMQRRVRLVQRHFVVNSPPKRFDVFHMILHSIWLRRLNIRVNHVADGV